jgi:hypothetical protein
MKAGDQQSLTVPVVPAHAENVADGDTDIVGVMDCVIIVAETLGEPVRLGVWDEVTPDAVTLPLADVVIELEPVADEDPEGEGVTVDEGVVDVEEEGVACVQSRVGSSVLYMLLPLHTCITQKFIP